MDDIDRIKDKYREKLTRLNAADVEQFNEYEQRIADLEARLAESQRHNELLRAVAEAAGMYISGSAGDLDARPSSLSAWDDYYQKLQAAIDGGALETGEEE